jgi:hypothetical protein
MADTLSFWGITRDARVVKIDFGAVPARSSGDVTFRVKNESSRYTAQAVTVDFDESAAGATQLFLSADGYRFATSLTLGDLPPAALSPVLTMRRVTASDAPVGEYQCSLRVRAAAWSSPPVT